MTTTNRYRRPDEDLVRAALARLGNLSTQRVFYSKLENPHWVSALDQVGAFSNPPAPITTADGTVRATPWPQGDYLVRMADLVPDAVAAVLARIVSTTNPWVRRSLLEAAARLPATQAAELADGIAAWADDQWRGLLDPRSLARLLSNLFTGDQRRAAMKIANAFYRPRPPEGPSNLAMREPRAAIDDYQYAQTLPTVARAIGRSRLSTLLRWLDEYERLRTSNRAPIDDSSHLWRPSIAADSGYHRVGDALVDAVRDAALVAFRTDPESIVDQLLRSDQVLARRIALDVCAEILDEVETAKEATPTLELMARSATMLLTDPVNTHIALRVEYMHLVHSCGRHLGLVDLTQVEKFAASGPPEPLDELAAFYREEHPDYSEKQISQLVNDYREHWQHRFLAGIGKDYLSVPGQRRLTGLDERLGVIHDPAVPAWKVVTGWVGDEPARPVTDMLDMDDDELLDLLITWKPEPRRMSHTSITATARALTDVIAHQPFRFREGGVRAIEHLQPDYLAALVSGWRAALHDATPIPWDFALDVLSQILGVSESAPNGERRPTVQSEYGCAEAARFVKDATTAQLSEAVRPTRLDLDRMVHLLLPLVIAAAPIDESGSDSQTDPLTESLNRARPEAFRALVRLLGTYLSVSARQSILDAIGTIVRERSGDLSLAAVLGESVDVLFNMVPEWLTGWTADIYGGPGASSPFHQVALSTALATHQPHSAILELLRESVSSVIRQFGGQPLVAGWRSMRSFEEIIGDWLVMLHVSGRLLYDDPLFVDFFAAASPSERGSVLGHLGWLLSRSESQVDEEVLARIRSLWESRTEHVEHHPEDAAELHEFYWYVLATSLPASWWLPQLARVVSIDREFSPRGMIGERVGESALEYPDEAFSVVKTLIENRDGDEVDYYDLIEHAVPGVLGVALESEDSTLRHQASQLMDRLGRAGYVDLNSRVAEWRLRRTEAR